MLKFIKSFFKKSEPVAAETAPYKMPEPAATTPIPLVIEPTPVAQAVVEPAAKEKPTKKEKAPAKPKAEKVAKVVAEKKPRAPRKPKGTTIG